MKRNATARIVIYSILALVLTLTLVAGLSVNGYISSTGSGNTVVDGEVPIEASLVKNINIDWVAGTMDIRATDTNHITISEVMPDGCKYKMVYTLHGDTLSINYGNNTIGFGFGNWSIPKKDLIITVPKDWACKELEIDGAALEVSINGVYAEAIELDGAAMELDFTGSFGRLDCDGAACQLDITAVTGPSSIAFDGAGCALKLTLPEDCGYAVTTQGLGISFDSDVQPYYENGAYRYGDGHCRINAEGLGCAIGVYYSDRDNSISEST